MTFPIQLSVIDFSAPLAPEAKKSKKSKKLYHPIKKSVSLLSRSDTLHLFIFYLFCSLFYCCCVFVCRLPTSLKNADPHACRIP